MDNNYLYIFGVLGFLLVVFIGLYFFKKNKTMENMDTTQIQQHIQQDHNIQNNNMKCDGDKCFINHT